MAGVRGEEWCWYWAEGEEEADMQLKSSQEVSQEECLEGSQYLVDIWFIIGKPPFASPGDRWNWTDEENSRRAQREGNRSLRRMGAMGCREEGSPTAVSLVVQGRVSRWGKVCGMHKSGGAAPNTTFLWNLLWAGQTFNDKCLAAGMANKNHSFTVHSKDEFSAHTVVTSALQVLPRGAPRLADDFDASRFNYHANH